MWVVVVLEYDMGDPETGFWRNQLQQMYEVRSAYFVFSPYPHNARLIAIPHALGTVPEMRRGPDSSSRGKDLTPQLEYKYACPDADHRIDLSIHH